MFWGSKMATAAPPGKAPISTMRLHKSVLAILLVIFQWQLVHHCANQGTLWPDLEEFFLCLTIPQKG